MKVVARLVEVLRRVRWLLSLSPERTAALEGLVVGPMSRCACGRLATKMLHYKDKSEPQWVYLCERCPEPPGHDAVSEYGNALEIEAANRQRF